MNSTKNSDYKFRDKLPEKGEKVALAIRAALGAISGSAKGEERETRRRTTRGRWKHIGGDLWDFIVPWKRANRFHHLALRSRCSASSPRAPNGA